MKIDYTEIFCYVDDFCKGFVDYWSKHILGDGGKKRRNRALRISLSEIATIILGYQESQFSCFKYYYAHVFNHHRRDFPYLLSYERFVYVMKRALPVLCALFQCIRGEITGIQFVDSTPLDVCKVIRASNHRVFKGIAKKSKTSTGWFFGLKLHAVFNEKSEIIKILITPGNTDDRKALFKMSQDLWGKIFGDRGYISEKLTSALLNQDLLLITRLKKNMKNKLLLLQDKFWLYKRNIVETIFGKLKLFDKLWHSRFRSLENAFCTLLACLISYQISPQKPSISDVINL